MSDDQTPAESVQPDVETEPVEPPTAPAEGDGAAGHDNEDDGPLARQAAKYRRRARDLETELAAAQETIAGLRRAQAESIAAAEGVKPAVLWAVTSLDQLLEDGAVDPAKVRAAVQLSVQELGVQPKRALDIAGEGRSTAPPGGGGKQRWDAAFKPSYQR